MNGHRTMTIHSDRARRRIRRIAYVLGASSLTMAMLTDAPPAAAQPGRKGSTGASASANDTDGRIAKGNELARKKKYAEAIAEYERAYAVAQDPKALFYAAKARNDSGDVAGAVRGYREYLRKVGGRDPQRQSDAMGEVQRLLGLVARV